MKVPKKSEIGVDSKYKLLYVLALIILLFVADITFAKDSIARSSSTVLKGRIQEVFNNESIQFPKLKARTALLDRRAGRPINKIPDVLKSFPVILRGNWKGYLTVRKVEFNPVYFRQSPADAAVDKSVFVVGRVFGAKFRFYGRGRGSVALEPEVKVTLDDNESSSIWGESGAHSILLNLGAASVGKGYISNSRKSWLSERVLSDKIENLGENLIEQRILVLSTAIHKKSKLKRMFFSEHVNQFEKVGSFRLRVSIAEVEYGPERTWWKKVLLEGEVR